MSDHTRPQGCKAYERGDQWFCDKCQYVWDINDDDPPVCDVAAEPIWVGVDMAKPGEDKTVTIHRAIGNSALTVIKENLNRE